MSGREKYPSNVASLTGDIERHTLVTYRQPAVAALCTKLTFGTPNVTQAADGSTEQGGCP